MNKHIQNIMEILQQENLTSEQRNAVLGLLKEADKELEITSFKLDRTEKVKRTTAILLEETITELEQKRKAVEAQNRELEIEAALERIRAAAMAMRDSSALGGIIFRLYSELTYLDAKLDRCFIMIVNPENQGITWWMAGQEGLLAENGFFVQMNQHASHLMYLDYCRKREKKWTYLFEGKEKRDWDRFGFSKTELVRLPEPIKAFMAAAKQVHLSGSSDQFGSLVTGSFEPLPDEQQEIISRFSVAFNQAYIRFLDLQKAEAQAREAQIQLALERVRARTMAMHVSKELKEVAKEMRKQFSLLGKEELETCAIHLWDEVNGQFEGWAALRSPDNSGELIESESRLAIKGIKILEESFRNYREGKKDYVIINDYEKAKEFFTALKTVDPKSYQFLSATLKNKKAGDISGYWSVSDFPGGSLVMVTMTAPAEDSRTLLRRFANVFGLAFRRYLDIKKAEAQTREAQIEAALERVRSSSMAMHKSEELKDVIKVVLQQFVQLNINVGHAGFYIDYKAHDDMHIWLADPNLEPFYAVLPYFDTPTWNSFLEAKANGTMLHTDLLNFKTKNKFYKSLFKLFTVPEEAKQFYMQCKGLAVSTVLLESIGLYIENFAAIPYTEEENEILIRIAKVFQQTYTRFLDLQKAEAQAREAEIQLALERVRAKSLAMHHTSELQDVVNIAAQQLHGIGMDINGGVFIAINAEVDDNLSIWASGGMADYVSKVKVPPLNKPIFFQLLNAIKAGNSFLIETYSDKEKRELFTHLFNYAPWSNLTPERKQELMSREGGFARSVVISQYTSISITNHYGKSFSENENNILKRFGNVFEQSYTRFLDLQKAEEQAREAQIEAALERVRSKTMAMHNSADVGESVATLFEELITLGVLGANDRCGIGIMHPDEIMEAWTAAKTVEGKAELTIGYLNMAKHPLLKSAYDGWKTKKETNQYILTGDDKLNYHEAIRNQSDYKIKRDYFSSVERIVHADFYFTEGCLYVFSSNEFTSGSVKTIIRFTNVFGQTYRRYLDLQKAEVQAREAQIETALERVRAQAMAMHHSEDLGKTIMVYYEQLDDLLSSTIVRCGAGLLNRENTIAVMSTASRTTDGETYHVKGIINMQGHPLLTGTYEHWLKQEEYQHVLRGNEIKEYYQYITNQVAIPENKGTDQLYFYFPMFTEGSFYIVTNSELPENELQIFRRFSSVLSLTYRRFNDLQKAEAQAREARIEAALEKVRSRAMAMHQSNDIAATASTAFEELKKLGIHSMRCGVGLFTKNSMSAKVYAATNSADGNVQILVKTREMSEHEALKHQYKAWLQQKDIHEELKGQALSSYYDKSFFQVDGKKIAAADLSKPEYGYYYAFPDGLFYSWSDNLYNDDEQKILNRFRSIIALTFRRFLDLQKAEAQAREAQIEAALERVRASTMAMHKSEQLAETAKVLFEQFDLLGKIPDRISIGIIKEEKQLIEWWVTNQNGSQLNYGFNASITESSMAKVFTAWKEKNESIVIDLTGKDLQDWIRFVREEVKMEIDEANMKGRRVHQGAFFSHGVLLFSTHEPVADDVMQLLVRFARVFNQTYTRFLDLQKAEIQAKEAIKASSLDRVRGEIASMRTVDDLQRITPIIWHELIALGVPFVRCGVFIMNEATEHVQVHLSAPDGRSLGLLDLPFNSSELTINSVNYWRKGIIFKTHWNRQDFLDFMQSMVREGQVQSPETYQGAAAPPESLDLHFVPFKQGMLYVGNSSPLEIDELQLVKSLAESFSIAYARYEDFRQLEEAKNQIEKTFIELKAAQAQLIQSEKMASLGELTAGIAHEIQNPLNFVNNFSEVSNELIDEMKEELAESSRQYAVGSRQSGEEKLKLAEEIANDIKQNLEKINHHGKRAADIVKGMLQHSRTSSGVKEPTDLNTLTDEYLRLSYHGLRAKDKSFNADFKTEFDESLPKINVIPQEIGRVLLNLINNAFYAVHAPLPPQSGFKETQSEYKPLVIVKTSFIHPSGGQRGACLITVKDNGPGIPEEIKDKIFQPFFTTKPTGQGTGLGLSLSYDIVKAHGGELKVETKEGGGSEFFIQLPIS